MLGSHLSIAGGMVNALHEARRLKFDTVQVFTKNQRQWKITPLKEQDLADWLEELAKLGWEDRTVSHATYLANLASPEPELWEKSVVMMREEILRCHALSIPFLVFHPGAHKGDGEADLDAGIDRIANAVARLIDETSDARTVLCLEDTAGSGTTIGRTFEELGEIARRAESIGGRSIRNRIGFCLDTCHALAAGYDLTTPAGVKKAFNAFDKNCGLGRLRVLHLNDSKGALGSRIDRHTHIGDGAVGMAAFEFIMNHPDLEDVPKILETPKGETPKGTPWDSLNRRRLLKLVKGGAAKPRQTRRKAGVR